MSKGTLIGIVIALLLVAGGAWYLYSLTANPQSQAAADHAAISAMVGEFGGKLQKVSLLASTTEVSAAMQAYYAPYLSPELLAAWQADPSHALGRQTSSPWPDRIEVSSIEPIAGSGSYQVEANIIEVANGAANTTSVAAVTPVSLTVEKLSGSWVISAVQTHPSPLEHLPPPPSAH